MASRFEYSLRLDGVGVPMVPPSQGYSEGFEVNMNV